MKILFLWQRKFENAGGVGRVTETLCKEFIKLGHEVNLLALTKGKSYTLWETKQDFTHVDYATSKKGCTKKVVQYLMDNKIDVIINQTGMMNNYALKTIRKALPNVKIVSVHHNCITCLQDQYEHIIRSNFKSGIKGAFIKLPGIVQLLKWFNKLKYGYRFEQSIQYSDRLILLSKSFIPELKHFNASINTQKVSSILNPAPFQTSNSNLQKEDRLVYVGRINKGQKQAHLLLELWKRISPNFKNWHFDIVGDGDYLEEMKQEASHLGLSNIHFHGYTDPQPLLQKAKIFPLVSSFEGFGMVLVEALAFEVVPVAFRCFNAIDDIIKHSINGVIVPHNDINKLCDDLGNLMHQGDTLLAMQKNCTEGASKFSRTKIAQEWMAMIGQL